MSWIIVGVAIALLLGALVAVFVSVIFVKKGSETEWQESIAAQPDPTFSPTVTPTEVSDRQYLHRQMMQKCLIDAFCSL